MNRFDAQAYGPAFAPLLEVDRRRPLDAGTPKSSELPLLKPLSVKTAFGHAKAVSDPDMAACCISGIWLLHDFLDESHRVSQDIDIPSGSFWHGVMHRREGDFSNAKYWFRRVGNHEVIAELGECVPEHRELLGSVA